MMRNNSFLVVIILVNVCFLSDGADFTKVDNMLKLINKPAIKTIQSEDGDIIDCVDIYKQPAFDHPALKNHTIQMRPSIETKENNSSHTDIFQIWHRSGTCPKGTIPIRRTGKEEILRASSFDRFAMKPPYIIRNGTNKTSSNDANDLKIEPSIDRSVAMLVTLGYNYIGATGDINVWNPSVAADDEYTTAQIWLKNGPGNGFESVEAGWVVNPKLFGDRNTRLFAYWTKDAYKTTGCFNLACSGFIQTSTSVALGAQITPLSSFGGRQYYLTTKITEEPNSGNWYLAFGNNAIGYWPAELFSLLRHSSTFVHWGGEVYSKNVRKSPHTKTAMGSGKPASSLEGQACSIKSIRIIDYSLQLKYPEFVAPWDDESYCYSSNNFRQGIVGEPTFYFGGAGQSRYCP